MKSESSAVPRDFFVRVSVNFNLWAPLAAKFVLPVALSRSPVSSSGVTNDSATENPIR